MSKNDVYHNRLSNTNRNDKKRDEYNDNDDDDDNNNNNNDRKAIYLASLGGLLLGFSVFAHPTSVIVIPGFVICSIFLLKRHNNKKGLIFFLTILTVVLFFMALVNYLRFGSFIEFGFGSYYGTLASHHSWTGLIGLLASPGKGLVFYFPVIILLPLALKYMYKQKENNNKNRWLFFLIIYIISVHWLYFGTMDDSVSSLFWSGAIAWGPRYLVPVLPFIVLPLGTLLLPRPLPPWLQFRQSTQILRISLIALCVAGFSLNLPGKLIWSEYVTVYAWDKEESYKVGRLVDVMTWYPYYSPIVLHMKVLLHDTDYVSNIPIEEYRYSPFVYFVTYGLAPCPYDLYVICKFGIIPILVLSAVLVLLALAIITDKRKREEFRKLRGLMGYFRK